MVSWATAVSWVKTLTTIRSSQERSRSPMLYKMSIMERNKVAREESRVSLLMMTICWQSTMFKDKTHGTHPVVMLMCTTSQGELMILLKE